MTGIIGAEVMAMAIHGHIQRMGSHVEDITQTLQDLDASPDDVGSALKALADARDDGTDPRFYRAQYMAAALEGVVIGIRAARIADEASRVDLVRTIALWLRHVDQMERFTDAPDGAGNPLWDASLKLERVFGEQP